MVEPDGDLRGRFAAERKAVDPNDRALGAEGVAADGGAHISLEEKPLRVIGLPGPASGGGEFAGSGDRLGR